MCFFQEAVVTHAPLVVKGMLSLMELCPKEAANLRKELLVAARHIFATDLRLSIYLLRLICEFKELIIYVMVFNL